MKTYTIAYTQNCDHGFAPEGGIIDAGEAYAPKISKERFRSHREAAAFAAADAWEGATSQVVRRLPNGRGWRIVGGRIRDLCEEISLNDALGIWTEEQKEWARQCVEEWRAGYLPAHTWPAAGEFADRNGGFYWAFGVLNCNGWTNEKPFRYIDLRQLID